MISVEELRRLRAMELEHDARLIKEAVRQSKGAVGIEELLRAWRGGTVSKPALASKAAPRKAAVRRITRKGRS
ncbi:MAG: hypothetical protein A2Z07_00570 [Armatimonadetes bacterium RBG_16_67_12]|nr:MAG: hypothetical protein A2Z07_00570 [Armatimonadetes bacterium RBG_16_67_12]